MGRFLRTRRGNGPARRRQGLPPPGRTPAGTRQMTALERSVHRAQITKVSMASETTAQIGW